MTDGHAPAGDHALLARGAWWHARHPRRDRPGVPVPDAPDEARAARAASLVDGVRGEIDNVLALPGTDPAIAEAARAYLGGAADPLGAAAVAHIAGITGFLDGRPDGPSFPHAWVARHGDAFAAAAVAELGGIAADATYVRPGYAWGGVRARAPRDTSGAWWLHIGNARWLRTRLAAAPDDVYAAAVAELAERRGHELQKLVAAYLAPTRGDWVEELCGNPGAAADVTFHGRWLLFCALGAPHQPAALGLAVGYRDRDPGVLTSLVDGVGAEAAAPLIVEALEQDLSRGTQAGALPEVLAGLPVDAACRALVDRIDRPGFPPAVLAAARGFPARVLPLLAASDSARAADLLAARVRAEPDLAASLLPDRPAEARLPDAADLPPLLTEPPWTKSRTGAEPLVLENLPAPGVTAVAWAPGEREEWAAHAEAGSGYRPLSEREIAEFDAGDLPWFREVALFTEGPDDQARPRLRTWEPESEWDAERWLPVVVARFEADAAGAAVSVARRAPTALGRFLLPLLSDEIARTMADWLVRLKTAAQEARAWFARHGAAAAPALIPDALGKAGRRRGAAEAALRLIADREGAGPVVAAARVHGDAAAAAIEALVTADPLDKLPAVIPSADWVEIRALPRLLLRGRTHALPDEAVAHVLTMLAMSKPDEVYAGVPAVVELCDRESLAEFGWALFRWWEACGSSSKENWALTQLGLTGDDGTVLRLAPVIRAWPGESGHARAVLGLDVLAAIGTETALTNLHSIAQRVKFKGLKAKAQEKIEEVAAGLGLTGDELGDRLVPDFGLDASGTLTLDYGARRFTVGFDEQLKPTVTDDGGKVRKSLPKPGAKDDPDLAPAAYKRFAALKKDVRTVAADQIARLERAMVDGRRWPLGEFRELLAGHPLVGHLVRRLVWLVEGGSAFRVAEDGTFADAADETLVLPDTARVGIAHPVHLGDGVKAWSELFADYEILQPFEQLARPVHALTEDERAAAALARLDGLEVPPGAVLGLVDRGWERAAPQDAGVEPWISRRAGAGRYVVIDLRPGITVGRPDEFGDQALGVRIADRPGDRYSAPDTGPAFGDLDPVTASEVLADLARLAASAR